MEHFPEIHTPRLHLRKVGADDIPALVKHANNKKISEHVLNIPYPYQEPDAVFRISYAYEGFRKRSRYVFAIISKERGELIGEIGLHPDNSRSIAQLAYWIGESQWGKGFASEAVAAVLEFGFKKLNLTTIFAECHTSNKRSEKVLLKNGLKAGVVNGNVGQYIKTPEN